MLTVDSMRHGQRTFWPDNKENRYTYIRKAKPFFLLVFYPRDAVVARYTCRHRVSVCLSVCLSVRYKSMFY